MNERILELAKKASLKFQSETDLSPAEQKFAELIVRECIQLCDQVDLVGADDCIDNIKQHFEIKE
jgi:hypothetical protein